MLPPPLLQSLSPAAAKIFLCLLSLQDESFQAPGAARAHAPLKSLATLSALSPRTCKRALAELRSLKLLSRLPGKYHQPATYLLTLSPQTEGPSATPTSQPKGASADTSPSPSPRATPQNNAKTPSGTQMAPLLNTNPAALLGAIGGTSTNSSGRPLNPQLLARLLSLPADQTALLLASLAAQNGGSL